MIKSKQINSFFKEGGLW